MPNISQSKGSQTMKFHQLIEYNRNIFLQKLCRKCGVETIPRLFFKKSNLTISLDQQSKVSYSLFFIAYQGKGYRNIVKLSCRSLAFTTYKAFLKNKKWSGTSLCASFSALFLNKNIYLVIFHFNVKTDQISQSVTFTL